MKKAVRPLLIVLFVLGLSASIASCMQSEGDRCQLTGDCGGDLICCVRDDIASRIGGGICTPSNKCELVRPDAGVRDAQTDAGADDASEDLAASDVASSDVTPDTEPDAASDVVPDTTDAGSDAVPDTTDAG
jgi:hypothetical protein